MSLRTRLARGLTRDTYLVAATSLFADISTEMLYPILPGFITVQLGASAGTLGLIEGLANATQYLTQGPSGWLSDRLVSRRLLAAAGFFVAAIAKPFIGASVTWPEAAAARILDRAGTGTRSAPRDAMIAASADEEARGRAFGLESLADNFGAFVGPLLTVLLLFTFVLPIRQVFYVAVLPGLASAVLVLLVRDRRAAAPHRTSESRSRARGLPGTYWRYLVASGLFGLGNASNALLILRAENVGLSFEATILVYAGFNLCAALASLPAGYVSDLVGRKATLVGAFAIFVVTYAGFAAGRGAVLAGALLVLFGLFQGTYRAMGKAIAADLSPEQARGTGLGLYAAVIGITSFVASVIGGQLWDRAGPSATYWYGAAFGVAGMVAMAALLRGGRRGSS